MAHPTFQLPRPTPARLTLASTRPLPVVWLLALALAYLLAGLVGRDPWKNEDLIGLGQMMTLAAGQAGHWALPEMAGIALEQEGPLAGWVGALLIALAGPWLGEVHAARLGNLLWFGLAGWALWSGTRRLAERPSAQPLPLPFGDQPNPASYARAVADASVLLALATIGLLWRSHETSAEPAALAMQALALRAAIGLLGQRPQRAALALGLAVAGAFLARGVPAILPLLLGLLVLLTVLPRLRPALSRMLLLSLPIALLPSLGWLAIAYQESSGWVLRWWAWNLDVLGWLTLDGLGSLIEDLPWFLWPAWPLLLLAAWRWRAHLHHAHISLPLGFLAGGLLALMVTSRPVDAELLALLPAAVMLGAFALPTLRRGWTSALDWFSLMAFSLAMGLIWLGWIAVVTGSPAQIARNFARQTGGFEAGVQALPLLVALVATGAWIVLIGWRLRSRPAALWRGSALAAGGATAAWILLMTLWLPSLNVAKSYQPMVNSLSRQLAQAPGGCVRGAGLALSHRAALWVHGRLQPALPSADCPLVLLQAAPEQIDALQQREGLGSAQRLWEGARPADSRERFRLLAR